MSSNSPTKISALAQMTLMLREMERDVGLEDLSAKEMDVFLAAHVLTGAAGTAVTSDEIRRHELTAPLAPASFHRALKSLLDFGLLETANGYKTRHYIVRPDFFA